MRITTVLALALLSTNAAAQFTVVPSQPFATANRSPILTYDEARQRLVFACDTEIWEWDGASFAARSAFAPARITRCVYDPARRIVFMVSGARLVSYDGHDFVDRDTASLPMTSLVADTGRQRLIAIGLVAAGNIVTNEWDGTGWRQVATITGNLRTISSAAYDAERGVTVAQILSISPFNLETWEWNGVSWILRDISNTIRAPLVFDPGRRRVIGMAGATWSWDGTAWTQVGSAPPFAPPLALASDPTRGLVWTFASQVVDDDVHAWDGTSWSPRLALPHPYRSNAGFSTDLLRGVAVLFGGSQAAARDTLSEWDGVRWQSRSAPGPAARDRHAQAFDVARGETVVFGGSSSSNPFTPLGDTWAWNGTNWRMLAAAGPPPRADAAMTFDSGRNRVVLVGGRAGAGAIADHWEWDGTSWSQIGTATPMGQVLGKLGYDPLRSRLVQVTSARQTWEHDGTAWTVAATATPQASGASWQLTWDPARQRLQGDLRPVSAFDVERFEWDGVQWTPLGARGDGILAFDLSRNRMLSYSPFALRIETPTPAGASDYGTGCSVPGAAIATSLSAFGRPVVGDAAFHLDVRANGALRPAAIGFGLAPGSLPLGNGCSLLVGQSFQSVLVATDANGFTSQPLPLPNALWLRGAAVFAQAAVLEPAAPGGFVLSQGLRLDLGD